jgi:hypothetical protein
LKSSSERMETCNRCTNIMNTAAKLTTLVYNTS